MSRLAGLLLGAGIVLAPSPAQDGWDRAEAAIDRLGIDAFDVPAAVAVAVRERGCTVPQATFWDAAPHNVVAGEFLAADQTVWAVLCSTDGSSRVLVLAESGELVGELGESPDRAYLQGMGEGTIEFSRHLDVASPERIRQAHENHGEGALRPVHHDGIEDGFQGKASGIWYFTGSEWIELVGAD